MLSAQNLEEGSQNDVHPLPQDVLVSSSALETSAPSLDGIGPPHCCCPTVVPGQLPPGSVYQSGGVLSQPCLWRGGTCLSRGCTPRPVSVMVPKTEPAFPRGQGGVLHSSCCFCPFTRVCISGDHGDQQGVCR